MDPAAIMEFLNSNPQAAQALAAALRGKPKQTPGPLGMVADQPDSLIKGMGDIYASPDMQKFQEREYVEGGHQADTLGKQPVGAGVGPYNAYVAPHWTQNLNAAANQGKGGIKQNQAQAAMMADLLQKRDAAAGAATFTRDRAAENPNQDPIAFHQGGALIGAQAGGPLVSAGMMEKQAHDEGAWQLKQTIDAARRKNQQEMLDKSLGLKLTLGQMGEEGKDRRFMPYSSAGTPTSGVATTDRSKGTVTTIAPVLNPNKPAAAVVPDISEETMANWATALRKTGKMPQLPRGIQTLGIRDAIVRKALEQDPSYDQATAIAGNVAKTTALNKLKIQEQMVGAFEDTARRNIDVLKGYIGKIPNLGSPALNRPARWAARQTGNKDVAGFETALLTVQQEAARVLATANANGIVTDNARHEMQQSLSAADTPEQAIEALNVIVKDFGNRRAAHRDGIKALMEDIGADTSVAPADKATPAMDAKRKAELESRY
jgi:hypothetical protein